MMKKYAIVFMSVTMTLSCSQVRQAPAPVESPKTVTEGKRADGVKGAVPIIHPRSYRKVAQPQKTEANGVQVIAYQAAQKSQVTPVYTSAISHLLSQAKEEKARGDYQAASMSLFRALEIEGKNANLWHQIADINVRQANYPNAIEMAKKSNTLAVGNPALRQKNWRLIAKSRRLMGNESGATDADNKAVSIY